MSISQLSGGEKTLTATALLFGIYLLKPALFCIFDEVDAPLDDANIDKFNNIIRKFSKDSQFIIITHNKRTMAATDIMYGITMVETGVTQVVPVDLTEMERDGLSNARSCSGQELICQPTSRRGCISCNPFSFALNRPCPDRTLQVSAIGLKSIEMEMVRLTYDAAESIGQLHSSPVS